MPVHIASGWIVVASMLLLSCTSGPVREGRLAELLPPDGPAQENVLGHVLLSGAQVDASFRERALQQGVVVEGEAVLRLTGTLPALLELELKWEPGALAAWDAPLELTPGERSTGTSAAYLAGKEFGLEAFLSRCPECDGKGVRAGVLDDGVSAAVEAFRVTSWGERKFLRKGSSSGLLDFSLKKVTPSGFLASSVPSYVTSYVESCARAFGMDMSRSTSWSGEIRESELKPLRAGRKMDLNLDGKFGVISLAVFEYPRGSTRVCVDVNEDGLFSPGECQGIFSETSDFGWWNEARQVEWTAEFDAQSGILTLTEGERTGIAEAHGEGVASVFLGNRIGGRWNGVAPGAQLLDYDIWAASSVPGESLYTMGQFIQALEWFGKNGAEVVNISYTLHFSSASSQEFMSKALGELVKRYQYVLAFSAGNEGPAMGSLHRRGIYPPSVLVTGAYLSSELAESVNGETSVPGQGRVSYYSSRGPGPDQGSGPLIIAPVSSLVHRTPGAGYSSFSGTSSASPAAAGLAAVLISAIKRENLPVDPVAVVHALRQSATRLEGTAFIDQGYGVPNIDRALDVYRDLIAGRHFAYVEAEILNRAAADGVTARGVLLRSSEGMDRFDARVRLRGTMAKTGSVREESVRPVLLRYSHDWMSGPARLWLAQSPSAFSLSLDIASIVVPRERGEVSGEIAIIDEQTERVLHVIPITFVDDQVFEGSFTAALELGTEEGTRFHLSAPRGVTGIRVRTDIQRELEGYFELKLHDASGKMTFGPKIKGGLSEVLIPISKTGWHQLAFYRVKGAGKPIRVDALVQPVFVNLMSRYLDQKAPVVQLEHFGETQDFMLDLFHESQLIKTAFVLPDSLGEYVIEAVIEKPGTYSVQSVLAEEPEVSAFFADCYWTYDEGAKPLLRGHGSQYVVTARGGRLRFSCRAFEHLGKAWQKSVWKMSLLGKTQDKGFLDRKTWIRLSPGLNRVRIEGQLPRLEDHSLLSVWLRPVFGSGFINLGVLEAHSETR